MDLKAKRLTITVPNEDMMIDQYTVCPKEMIQKAYLNNVGQPFDFCGDKRIISDVRITDDFIFIDLIKD